MQSPNLTIYLLFSFVFNQFDFQYHIFPMLSSQRIEGFKCSGF